MIGRTVSHYRVLRELGGGGMGVVYEAEDLALGRRVALKFLPESLAAEPRALARFRAEARAASALDHPHICTVHDLGEAEGRLFLVLELLEGETLKHRIASGPLPLEEVLRLGRQVAEALAAAHERGIVHRDVKPANVFVTRGGDARVLDFGLAKITEERDRDEMEAGSGQPTALLSPTATRPGAMPGTVAYMSPEQLRGEELDARTDLFSLGVVLYEMTTGRHPFAGRTAGVVIDKILNQPPAPPPRLDGGPAAGLGRVLEKALEKDRRLRYQSARDLLADLRRLRRGLPGAPPLAEPPTPPAGRRPRRRLAAAAAGAVALALLAVLWAERGTRRSPGTPAAGPDPAAAAQPAPSIAVLPFVDMSPGQDQAYFADGLAEELLDVLAQIRGLRVSARTSSFSFRGRSPDLAEVGDRLNVGTVLEGSVRKAGNDVRISVRLTDVAEGFSLWSQTYDRRLDDILEVQSEIARSVAAALKQSLPALDEALDRPRARDVEAYNAYLHGRYFLARQGEEDLERAVTYFRRAVEIDDAYALAWAGLGQAYNAQLAFGYLQTEDGVVLARRALQRAVELDPTLAEAYAWRGEHRASFDFDWVGADADLQRALELKPGANGVLVVAARVAASLGRFDEALELGARVVAIDPLNTEAWLWLGIHRYQTGLLDQAAEALRKALELEPGRALAHLMLGEVELLRGRPQAALREIESEPHRLLRLTGEALVYRALGHEAEAEAALAALIESGSEVAAYQIGEVYGYWGDADRAFAWFERAYDQRDAGLAFLAGDPLLAGLWADPRWERLLRRLGLPREAAEGSRPPAAAGRGGGSLGYTAPQER